jgi:hypothetical protein
MTTALDIFIGFIAGLLAVVVFAVSERVYFRTWLAGCGAVIVYSCIFWTVFIGTTSYLW